MLTGETAALVVALLAGHSSEDTGLEPTVMGSKIDLSGDACQRADADAVAEIEEVLLLARMAMQSVQVVHDDGVSDSSRYVFQHALVLRALLARVRAGVVVLVNVCDGPAAALSEGSAVLDLTPDAQGRAVRVGGDPCVDRSRRREHQGTLAYPGPGERPVTRPIIGRHPRLTAVVPQPTFKSASRT